MFRVQPYAVQVLAAPVGCTAAILARELVRDCWQPKLQLKGSNVLVALPLPPGNTHHLFISHVRRSAQEQARVLQDRLQAVVPGLRVWLDTEGMADATMVERTIDSVQAVLCVVSVGYFQSKSCMRELLSCLRTQKPLIAVVEHSVDHGGITDVEASSRSSRAVAV